MTTLDGSTSWFRRWVLLAFAVSILLAAPLGASPAGAESPPGAVTLDNSCTPDAFRPDEWTVVECVTNIANVGDEPVSNLRLSIEGGKGTFPDFRWMWGTTNGQLWSAQQGTLVFGGEEGALEPGQSAESHLIMLLNMSEGTYESELKLKVGAQTVAQATIYFAATENALAPPTDLVVTTELVSEQASDGGETPTAIYETRITNRGSRTVDDLNLTQRFAPALVAANPSPDSQNDALALATWSLASFDRDSLAPGESLILQTIDGNVNESSCIYASADTVVEATFAGEKERYGAHARQALLGNCHNDNPPGTATAVPGGGSRSGGSGQPAAAPATGEGLAPAGDHFVWVVTCLAAAGAALIWLATIARRRARR